ncbi:helix-turn-helix transcriptional regulator [Nonomuraea sp. NPDC048881]|uniref:helix-turn-helix domain-containing protein n=1 Tax=Nonomuraea sp. NPDC048881 TaxID=3155030 RepID=UPI0033FDB64A
MTDTMTGRAVGAPRERLYEELRQLRKKAGNVSYGYIAQHNKLGLTKTTVSAVFTGKGRKGPPSWENVAAIFEVLQAKLGMTGVQPVKVLGSLDDLYQLHQEAIEEQVATIAVVQPLEEPAPATVSVPVEETPLQEFPVVSALPTSASPSLPAAPAGVMYPHQPAWPAADGFLPVIPVPAWLEPAPICLEHQGKRLVDEILSGELNVVPPLPLVHQPVEQEAALALLAAPPWGQSTTERLRRWFGPRGLELITQVEGGHAVATFELSVLLINHDAIQEGMLFLQQAAQLDGDLAIELPGLRVGDHLCGSVIRDICQRVADGYKQAGYRLRQQLWTEYTTGIDIEAPIAMMVPTRGRHSRGRYGWAVLNELEVQRVKKAYWRSRAFDGHEQREPETAPLTRITEAFAAGVAAAYQNKRRPHPVTSDQW